MIKIQVMLGILAIAITLSVVWAVNYTIDKVDVEQVSTQSFTPYSRYKASKTWADAPWSGVRQSGTTVPANLYSEWEDPYDIK